MSGADKRSAGNFCWDRRRFRARLTTSGLEYFLPGRFDGNTNSLDSFWPATGDCGRRQRECHRFGIPYLRLVLCSKFGTTPGPKADELANKTWTTGTNPARKMGILSQSGAPSSCSPAPTQMAPKVGKAMKEARSPMKGKRTQDRSCGPRPRQIQTVMRRDSNPPETMYT